MDRLILHIGQYKTGSTSIQRSLARARDDLRAQGILYPQTGIQGDGHAALATRLRRETEGGAAFDPAPLLAEIEASGCGTVILSAEALSGRRLDMMDADIVAASLRRLGTLFAGCAITVVYFWRRQDEAVESRMIETIKGRGHRADPQVEAYLQPGQAIDLAFFDDTIRSALPQAQIVARAHASALLEGGEVVADFLHATGLDGALRPEQRLRANVSPSGRMIALLRALNRLSAAGRDVGDAVAALRRSPLAKGAKAVLLDRAARARIMDAYAASNARFVAECLPEAARAGAAAYLGAPPSDAGPNVAATADELAQLLAAAGDAARTTAKAAEPAPPTASRGQVRIYLGAHKTASTHLQDLLGFHRDALAAQGTAVALPGDVRGPAGWLAGFYEAVRQRQNGGIPPDLRARLREPMVAAAGQDWLVSDENILGVAREVSQPGSFYAYAPPRMLTLADLFADRDPQAFMALRSYDGFFASMYSEVVRNAGFQPFAQFRAGIDAVAGGWSWLPLVAGMVEGFGEARVTLWDFADFTALQPRIVALLAGVDATRAQQLIDAFPAQPTRPALSARTIELLAQLSEALGPEASQPLTERLDARFGTAAGGTAFRPFDPPETEALRARYSHDLAEIRSRWPGIRWLSPAA